MTAVLKLQYITDCLCVTFDKGSGVALGALKAILVKEGEGGEGIVFVAIVKGKS